MDNEQFDKLHRALNRIAAATLTASVLAAAGRKPTLKDMQTTFEDCYMLVDPDLGSEKQDAFQARIDKKEW